jgi:hypothetical protein
MSQDSVYMSLIAREVRCLVRDSKFIYLSILGSVIAPLLLFRSTHSVESYFAIPLIPAFVFSVVGPNQFGLDGPGFARFVLSPQPMRTVLLAKHMVLGAGFLLNTAIVVTLLRARGILEVADIASAIGLALAAFFLFLSVGTALSCTRPWAMPIGFGGNFGGVDAWIGQSASFVAAALPSVGLWLLCTRVNDLGPFLRMGLLGIVTLIGACVWWLTVRAAAAFAERNAMAIQTRLMP